MIRRYLKTTSLPLFSLMAVLPMAVIYELLVWYLNQSDITGVRNGADNLLKQLLSELGFWGLQASVILFFSAFIIVSILHRIRPADKDTNEFHFSYYPLVLLESFIYGAGMLLFFQYIVRSGYLFTITTQTIDSFVYSLGAGVYEELVFRAIIMQGLFLLFRLAPSLKNSGAWMVAAVLSSLIFVMSHYIGQMGDTLTIHSFLLRFIGSTILSILYIFRGFAVAAYTHTFYDVLIGIFV